VASPGLAPGRAAYETAALLLCEEAEGPGPWTQDSGPRTQDPGRGPALPSCGIGIAGGAVMVRLLAFYSGSLSLLPGLH